MEKHVNIVGGGITGLIAAITAAEQGATATLYERASALGGRARTAPPPYRTNLGPHALYADGPLWRWLKARALLPPTRPAQLRKARFHYRGRCRTAPPRPFMSAVRLSFKAAPEDVDYRTWAAGHGVRDLDACCHTAGFYTFDADPGRLSARFVNERQARLVRPPSPSRFVAPGGWSALVERLEARARELGVEIRLGERVQALPAPPVIVATELRHASELLGETLEAPRPRAALLDVALTARRGDPGSVLDLDGGAFVEVYTAFDRALAPEGQALIQAHVGLRDGEEAAAGVARIEAVLDACFEDWRARETWRAQRASDGRSGAVELPGLTWRERPRIDRGGGVFLAGDAVAAPGLLAEVACASAVEAARAAML
jgi:hypothetical protein